MMTEVMVDSQSWDGVNVPTVYIDFLGQEVRVGDYVAYATSSSHSANVVVGQVLAFQTHNSKGEPYGSASWDYSVRPAVQKDFAHKWNMKVQPLLDSRFKWRGDYKTGKKKNVLIGTVMNVHKVDVSNATIEVDD